MTAGLIVHPFSDAKRLLQGYRRAVAGAPDDLSCWVVMRKAPPLPFLRARSTARRWSSSPCATSAIRARARRRSRRSARSDSPSPTWSARRPSWPGSRPSTRSSRRGRRNYWSQDFIDIGDEALDLLIAPVGRLPSPECEIFIGHLGGAVNRVPATATAYPHRDVNFVMNVHTRWGDASQDRACIGWARELFDRMAPHAKGGVYVNFMPEDEGERVIRGAYGPNYERLATLKARYDPENLFRLNQNIRPAAR